jgi:NTP pyrophosphatase (non-canonical NTP hydrolase)
VTESEYTESSLIPKLKELSFNQLVFFTEDLATVVRYHARQGASDEEWQDAQAMCVVEEAGEFIGAYRRWRGFARRDGSWNDVTKELSDVIIASLLMFAVMNEDAQCHVKAKLYEVISRGYVNKE